MKTILKLFVRIIGFGFLTSGCVPTWQQASQHIDIKSHEVTYSAGNTVLESKLPLSLELDPYGPGNLILTGPGHSALSESLEYFINESDLIKVQRPTQLDLLPNPLLIMNQSDETVFETASDGVIDVLGWSPVDSVLAYHADDKLHLVDLREEAELLQFPDREIQFLPSGGALLKKSIDDKGKGEIVDKDFEILHQFEIERVYLEGSYQIRLSFDGKVFELDASDYPSLYSDEICFDEELRVLTLGSVEFNLDTQDLYSSRRHCSRESLPLTDPKGLYREKLFDRFEVWQMTLEYQTVASTLETRTFNWKCEDKEFLVGEVDLEYSLQLTHPEGFKIQQSGIVTIVYEEPVCRTMSD